MSEETNNPVYQLQPVNMLIRSIFKH